MLIIRIMKKKKFIHRSLCNRFSLQYCVYLSRTLLTSRNVKFVCLLCFFFVFFWQWSTCTCQAFVICYYHPSAIYTRDASLQAVHQFPHKMTSSKAKQIMKPPRSLMNRKVGFMCCFQASVPMPHLRL